MPFLRYDDWWIRGFDYPRQQLIILLGIASVCWIISRSNNSTTTWVIAGLLVSCMLYQAYRILPYTQLHGRDSKNAEVVTNEEGHLSLMMCNVLQTNRRSDLVIEQVKKMSPDLLLTVETNGWWEEKLIAGIGEEYPHRVSVPLENLYGMHLWSKVKLEDSEILYRIKDDIPSIDAEIKLKNGREVHLHFVHPMPPSPTEAYASTGRDAELAMVGKEVRERGEKTSIVAGDLNDVAWSHSTRMFQRLSGLLDPRRGRGLFSTFHAEYRIARWPLDHVFHSSDLAVVDLERLPYVGSDHFPVFIKLSYEPQQDENQGETPEGDDLEEAQETIHTAKNGKNDSVLKKEDED